MVTRSLKLLLLASVAFFYTLVVFNNLTDFDSNYQFVRHVLTMDTTFAGNRGLWRALTQPAWHQGFYYCIILWETVTGALCWWGAVELWRHRKSEAAQFNAAKRVPLIGLTSGALMWMVAFLSVGAEWFLMWQSKTWNGQEASFRNFVVVSVVLLLMMQPDRADQA